MGKIEKNSLKKSFILAMAVTVLIIFLLSLFTIYAGYRMQAWIMPESDELYLEVEEIFADGQMAKSERLMTYGRKEPYARFVLGDGEELQGEMTFTIRRQDTDFSSLTPKRKAAYRFLSTMMFFLPVIFSAVGVGMCGRWFYRKKLQEPLSALKDATEHIRRRDLDFTVGYQSKDELGRLCVSFEDMRKALCENNREMWNMIENRKQLQMSIAHDLRTPITIIKGYIEYLNGNIESKLPDREKERHVLQNIFSAARRLECYVESVRSISGIEETEVKKERCNLNTIIDTIAVDFTVLADKQMKSFILNNHLGKEDTGDVDTQCLYRVLENIISNALRYAGQNIQLTVEKKGDRLFFVIEDDGNGFSSAQLVNSGGKLFYSNSGEEHLGMGIAISRILCGRMGGGMKLGNRKDGGAIVKIWIAI